MSAIIGGFVTGVLITVFIVTITTILADNHYEEVNNHSSTYRTEIDSNREDCKAAENYVGEVSQEIISSIAYQDKEQVLPQQIIIKDFDNPELDDKWIIDWDKSEKTQQDKKE